jgi:hypothetical protein
MAGRGAWLNLRYHTTNNVNEDSWCCSPDSKQAQVRNETKVVTSPVNLAFYMNKHYLNR